LLLLPFVVNKSLSNAGQKFKTHYPVKLRRR